MMIALTYLEFYSGIGGWGYALEHACRTISEAAMASLDAKNQKTLLDKVELRPRLLAAYDHSDLCNSVFLYNHAANGESPDGTDFHAPSPPKKTSSRKAEERERRRFRSRQTPIERLALPELRAHSADVWCMSPPCQPHTRQHANGGKEREDPRSRSFRSLCGLLGELDEGALPALVLLENVVGFEKSCPTWDDRGGSDDVGAESRLSSDKDVGSFQLWRRSLSRRNYRVVHMHLDPTHVGIPNNRPRHYTVAFRPGALRASMKKKEMSSPDSAPVRLPETEPRAKFGHLFLSESLDEPPIIHDERSLSPETMPAVPHVGSFLDAELPPRSPPTSANSTKWLSLRIPEKVRSGSSSWCFDIVTPHHRRSSCFTHSYGKFVRGTGSILYTGPLSFENSKADCLDSKEAWCNAVIGSYLGNTDNLGVHENRGSVPKNAGETDVDATADDPAGLLPADRFRLMAPEERTFDASWSEGLDWDRHVRYLSGTEIARLMGFPVAEGSPSIGDSVRASGTGQDDAAATTGNRGGRPSSREFRFPPGCTTKQQWKLLGNSLNVRVAACVAEMGIRAMLEEGT